MLCNAVASARWHEGGGLNGYVVFLTLKQSHFARQFASYCCLVVLLRHPTIVRVSSPPSTQQSLSIQAPPCAAAAVLVH